MTLDKHGKHHGENKKMNHIITIISDRISIAAAPIGECQHMYSIAQSCSSILWQLVNTGNTMSDKSITSGVCRISEKYCPVCEDSVGTGEQNTTGREFDFNYSQLQRVSQLNKERNLNKGQSSLCIIWKYH